jgi:hypothetical protein
MTTPSIPFDTCPTCKYWDRHAADPYGICRANPPVGHGWPRTSRDDWCGHWEKAPPAPEPVVIEIKKPRKNQAA